MSTGYALDFFIGPGIALGIQSLKEEQTLNSVITVDDQLQLLSGLGFHMGSAFYMTEWSRLVFKIRYAQYYQERTGFLPVTEAGLGLRLGFTP